MPGGSFVRVARTEDVVGEVGEIERTRRDAGLRVSSEPLDLVRDVPRDLLLDSRHPLLVLSHLPVMAERERERERGEKLEQWAKQVRLEAAAVPLLLRGVRGRRVERVDVKHVGQLGLRGRCDENEDEGDAALLQQAEGAGPHHLGVGRLGPNGEEAAWARSSRDRGCRGAEHRPRGPR